MKEKKGKLEEIISVCPECYKEGKINKIEGEIIEEDGKVWITKECREHGFFKDIYFGDVDLYNKWIKYKVTGKIAPKVKTQLFADSPLYDQHRSQTVLTNLMATNRCDLRCSYCFMNAGRAGYVYEPTLEQIEKLMIQAKEVGSRAIQITGGEPMVRDDIFDVIGLARRYFTHVQVNTNGIKLAESIDYCWRIRNAGVNTIYMSFDGVTKKTNPWLEQNKKAIENLRKVGQMVILVPVLIGDRNVEETGKIIRFALDNLDIVRGVNFQPISFCGSVTDIDEEKRKTQRVDYVRMIEAIEKEFDGQISREDFYPVPFVSPISRLIEHLKGEEQIEFTAHPGCGGATYLFKKDDGEVIPITRFLDVERMMDFIDKQAKKTGPFKKSRIGFSFLRNIDKFVDYHKAPEGFNLKQVLKDAALGGNYDSLREFHYNSLFVGSMWFQDAFNLNIDRLKRCVIHYTTFEGIVPFCTYNGLGYGDRIREKYSIPIKEWEKKTGKKMKDDLWRGGKE